MKTDHADPSIAVAAWPEPAVWDLVGNTPLVPIPGSPGLWLKAEWYNPAGSVKDRPARHILRQGLAEGALPGRRLLDASSGNTAIAYAALGAAAGIGVTVCVPENVSEERRRLLQVFGAQVIDTDPLEGSDGAIRTARELAAREDRYWYADQYNNPANAAAHAQTTGPEIWRDTRGAVTHLVAGVGTSGTIMGAGRFLRERNPNIRLIGVEPDAPFHGIEGLKHMPTAIVPGLYDASFLDETRRVSTEAAEAKVRTLARTAGLFLGWSGGAAVTVGVQLLNEARARAELERSGRLPLPRPEPLVVVIAPDAGSRYLSETRRLEE